MLKAWIQSGGWKKYAWLIIALVLGTLFLFQCSPKKAPKVLDCSLPEAIRLMNKSGYRDIKVEDLARNPVPKEQYTDNLIVIKQDPSPGLVSYNGITLSVRTREDYYASFKKQQNEQSTSVSPRQNIAPTKSQTTPPNNSPTTSTPTPSPVTPQPTRVYFDSCAEARKAGAAPIHRGRPGYRPGLDRDDDGVACE